MKIAVPSQDDMVCPHFGHCEYFTIAEVNDGEVVSKKTINAPPHEPGVLPRMLAGEGVDVVIAGGMGSRAQQLFNQQNIQVIVGASGPVDAVLAAYLKGKLETGPNVCDH
ncbi:MAG TPA: dinitrogenase iron-molybdenum cofactor [Peptococcaceae bacterium]|jgi:ATP-binding protein involved in chromosome partitioning|nr:dinitrogenase iron-molybdenum cofactor [Peptococcaceae bacterium]